MVEENTFTIDGVEYKVDDLSEKGQAFIDSLKFVAEEIKKTEAMLAVLNTAKSAYFASLKNELPSKIN